MNRLATMPAWSSHCAVPLAASRTLNAGSALVGIGLGARAAEEAGTPRTGIYDMFEKALDLLPDGIALLRRDGTIVFANGPLRHFAASGGDLRLDGNAVTFSTRSLRERFAAALGAAEPARRLGVACTTTDFAVSRAGELPPYTISVRSLPASGEQSCPQAGALLLVHDPLQQNFAAGKLLQELYGLTQAEAELVQSLGSGMTAVAYAKRRSISVTTAYTHLRRTREKTGWKSVSELTRRFHELNVSLRTAG
jgi:DNA-binding CsgD family transcriptional regulator